MNHFMGHCVLKVSLIFHFVCTKKYSVLRVKSSRFSIRASTTVDIVAGKVTSELSNAIAQIADDRAYNRCLLATEPNMDGN